MHCSRPRRFALAWTDTIALAPYVGLYGDYYFTHDDAPTIVAAGALPRASTPLLDGWSARTTAGFAARFASGATGRRAWRHRIRHPHLDLPRPRRRAVLKA
jgi:hypothetical protein